MEKTPPEQVMYQLLYGPFVAQLIYVAAKLGIADQLKVGTKTCSELAETLDAHPPTLYRVMRALASVGIFAETSKASFELTPLARLLRSDVPNSVRNIAILKGEEFFWRAKAKLLHSVKTGEVAFNQVHGMDVFEYFQRNTDAAEIFNRAMTDSTLKNVEGILAAYDFSGINKLVDVGGGRGMLIARILKAYPEMQGVLADKSSVIEGAKKLLKSEGVADQCELITIDFFESVPNGGDAYMLRHIIHDWDDERAVTILKNCHKQMNKGARLLLLEEVILPGNEPSPGKLLDIEMLVFTTGLERTEEEYRSLFDAAGFELTRIVTTKGAGNVIEGVPKLS